MAIHQKNAEQADEAAAATEEDLESTVDYQSETSTDDQPTTDLTVYDPEPRPFNPKRYNKEAKMYSFRPVPNKQVRSRDPVVAVTPDGKRIFGYNEKGKPVCYANKRSGGRCMSTFTYMNGRCEMHGGKAQSGVMHWNAQHLRSAHNLPKHLQGDMNRALHDPDNLNLAHEIALTDTHIAKLKEALDTGLDEPAWKKLRKLSDQLEWALENDPEATEQLCADLIDVVRKGSGERTVWREYHEVEECRRKLVATAHIREKDLKLLLKADQVIVLITACSGACREAIAHVFTAIESKYILTDRETRKIMSKIDPSIRLDFLSFVSRAMGKLINRNRDEEPIPVENLVKPPTKGSRPKK